MIESAFEGAQVRFDGFLEPVLPFRLEQRGRGKPKPVHS